ncbi:MAG: D-alanine--D-alanine ligase [Deltaproteobacteria bacterium CG_4_8_14_3_um_filter_51_11]|nr:D-alanine--D-alanine ligase [bacterium]OIP43277.1 MAG: D-alanine--D-alanine ligase [Desulfobacteraceae bacterium CG2_30_51_40]PIP46301.1 MAG: D-alanine--D-alanine ligase [Deltaproteobacteria bacterium CG23_combo_of_CG06-09_8_20_14_all_51_20]PIX18800.1 MAG: D-alanine--D-alanine ligase [Deltaproteobacteria bacterium CG_4_8_14_3_um_filter_51_11]PIY22842.1 MAG: D-alanine--D-alanine ligase [Deltaproteobacteria bacterium CG_4_10_14_3_um_filter_51_14]
MNVGITYDLRDDYLAMGMSEVETAEFDRADTVDAIDGVLRDLGFQTERIGNIYALTGLLSQGKRWDIVFNIAEGLRGYGREAQVPALLDAYGIPYTFSDPLVLSLTLHKAITKRVVRDLGIPTPDFDVITNHDDIARCGLTFPLFAKPLAEGTGKGITARSRIGGREELFSVCSELLEEFKQPVLVERFLPGREFTAGIIGTGAEARVAAVMEVILREKADADVYSYRNKEDCEELVTYCLAGDEMGVKAGRVALAAWRGLGCRDAGRVDLRSDEWGMPNFMEVNPLAGLHPEHSDLPILCKLAGMGYHELISEIMTSAKGRPGFKEK